jgi:cytochrome c peroxidase
MTINTSPFGIQWGSTGGRASGEVHYPPARSSDNKQKTALGLPFRGMPDRKRNIVWSAAALVAAAACACGQQGPFSDAELAILRTYVLVPLPADESNVYADRADAARLGKKLYFDARFSGPLGPHNLGVAAGGLGAPGETGKVACASCHDPGQAGADRRSLPGPTSLGAGYTTRNAPTVFNAAYSPLWQFWDGHADSLWSQALSPPEGPAECNSSRLAVVHVLADHYRADWDGVFGAGAMPDLSDVTRFPRQGKPGDPAYDAMAVADRRTIDELYVRFGKAIAAYERRLVSTAFEPSAFDRFMAGDEQAMNPAAIRGARLFVGAAGCNECHRGATFSDFRFHNIGIPQTGPYVPAVDLGRRAGIDALVGSAFNRDSAFSDKPQAQHIAALTPLDPTTPFHPTDGQFKTPSLRNVARTAPYMHDGAYATLWDVVDHYNFGGSTGQYAGDKDPAIAPLRLTDAELGDVVEFLRALDDGPPLATADFPEGLIAPPPLPP